jgi:S-adenosylmethionine decarboxylase
MTPFEGTEKKLEIILRQPDPGLREDSCGRWARVVEASGAAIISKMKSDAVDAYLLSESSMFLWADRILMITCGRTSLARSVPEILRFLPADRIGQVFYERKNVLYPDFQPTSFDIDRDLLQSHFPGKCFRLGAADTDHVNMFYSTHDRIEATADVTLQVLMHDLPVTVRGDFGSDTAGSNQIGGALSRLRRLCAGMHADDHFFEPAGYSLNAVQGDRYLTVHVTPQPSGSYASVETNLTPTGALVPGVLDIFQPRRFTRMLTASMDPEGLAALRAALVADPHYRAVEQIDQIFDCGYAVSFINCRHRRRCSAPQGEHP